MQDEVNIEFAVYVGIHSTCTLEIIIDEGMIKERKEL